MVQMAATMVVITEAGCYNGAAVAASGYSSNPNSRCNGVDEKRSGKATTDLGHEDLISGISTIRGSLLKMWVLEFLPLEGEAHSQIEITRDGNLGKFKSQLQPFQEGKMKIVG
ncbi:hypothetical protein L1987_39045 [Smallanthus sonchifolius]|uniref:Uncharacterized protein n=1 Tax=Smallanthus sonchifolius TaxID=185202 RepID=A0ACB9HMB0_9ASTR|nr:hypothetical protein L1987_39045 [Smallanthus sonchifolius]